MAFADLDGATLFYTDEGEGDPVLFVHGWTCDSHDWMFQLDDFAARHRVIAVDLRGHGRSSVPAAGYTPKVFAADLAALLGKLGVSGVVAIGHSLGAAIVSTLAVEYPDLVRAVVAVDSGYGIGRGSGGGGVTGGIRAGLEGGAPGEFAAQLLAGLGGPTTPRAMQTLHRRRALGMPAHVVAQALLGLLADDEPLSRRSTGAVYLSGRTCPTLAVAVDDRAEWDAGVSNREASRAHVWSGAGHWLHQERPDEFNALVLDWIAGLPSGKA